jgi:hypothetical protein
MSKKYSKDFWAGAKAVAEAVHATSDEDGNDLEASISRMVDLLGAVNNEEDPKTWSRFAAPEQAFDDDEGDEEEGE